MRRTNDSVSWWGPGGADNGGVIFPVNPPVEAPPNALGQNPPPRHGVRTCPVLLTFDNSSFDFSSMCRVFSQEPLIPTSDFSFDSTQVLFSSSVATMDEQP